MSHTKIRINFVTYQIAVGDNKQPQEYCLKHWIYSNNRLFSPQDCDRKSPNGVTFFRNILIRALKHL